MPSLRGLKYFLKSQTGNRQKRLAALQQLLFPKPFLATCDESWLQDVMAHDFLVDPAPVATRRAQLAAVIRHDVRKQLPTCKALRDIPTMLVRPGLDALITPQESDKLHALLPHATVLRLDEAGHGAIRQCKDQVNEALIAHFKLG